MLHGFLYFYGRGIVSGDGDGAAQAVSVLGVSDACTLTFPEKRKPFTENLSLKLLVYSKRKEPTYIRFMHVYEV